MTHLASERIVVEAPLSFTGSAKRIWRRVVWDRTKAWVTLALVLIALTWVLVAAWYLSFGLLVVPYRLIRRSSRQRRLAATRHHEQLAWTAHRTEDR